MDKHLKAEHSIVCRRADEIKGYFGWPTAAKLDNGSLIAASSGLRTEHVDPWGRTVINTSTDSGNTWSEPRVINNSPIDDRDAGILNLGGGAVLVSWFTSDTRKYHSAAPQGVSPDLRKKWNSLYETWTDDLMKKHLGSWIMRSDDYGETWGSLVRVPVTAPHGPVCCSNGDLLYLGKRFRTMDEFREGEVLAVMSRDRGDTWEERGTVPLADNTVLINYHEPHVLELPSGRFLGMIRIQNHSGENLDKAGITHFSIMKTVSDDRGKTWSCAEPLGFHGSPPHLMRHSSGVLILSYGWRKEGYGQRIAFSRDEGNTWDHDWIIRDDGPDGDLGYPSTVERDDGSLLTVYYQKCPGDEKCSLLCSKWLLP